MNSNGMKKKNYRAFLVMAPPSHSGIFHLMETYKISSLAGQK